MGQHDVVHFLVLQYLEGETLASRLTEGPLTVGDVLRYAIEIADALNHAHRRGIVHRDLKPGNIYLTKTGARLLDFGLAKWREVAPGGVGGRSGHANVPDSLTGEGVIVGTLHYMAPEQLEGKETDARADLFAFGVVTIGRIRPGGRVNGILDSQTRPPGTAGLRTDVRLLGDFSHAHARFPHNNAISSGMRVAGLHPTNMPGHLASDTERASEPDPRPQAALFDNRFNLAPERLAALIDTRRELLEGLAQHPEWAEMETELSDLLKSVLNSGCLQLLRIDRHTPTPVLDQIVKYEAVHPIRDSRDLERRMADDRRCYALFHPALPSEPLIFTEVALTHGMSSNAQALLDPETPTVDPSTCTCAIFYSISSCHEGLRGVPLGNALIGQVADELARVFPRLVTFATLSPVQGFRAWLTSLAQSDPGGAASARAASTLTSLERADWPADVDSSAELERQLMPLCAYYLLRVKRGDDPADPVARFHLRNGARLDRINWLSDSSVAGMRRSAGLMVNYVYRCNHPRRKYQASTSTRHVHASRQVQRLAGQASSLFCQ